MSKLVSVADLQMGDRFEFVAIGDKFAGSPMSDHPNLMVVANVPKTNRIANSCFFRYKSEDDPLEVRSWNGAAEIEVRLFTDRVVSPSGVAGSGTASAVATAAKATVTPSPAAAAPATNGLTAAMAALKSVFPDSPTEVKSILKAEPIAATKVDMRPAAKPAPTIVGPVDDEDEDDSEESSGKLSLRIPVKGDLEAETENESDDEPAADEAEAATKPARKRSVAKTEKKETAKSVVPKKRPAKSAESKSATAKPAKKKAAKPAAKKKS